ncbi:SAP domain-containing ribonucleoprotein-like [Lytechinus variegatus]|uniref:SAP domain-containing ribonucleoprotein-like n=1 Tax=Lytechinus variegatus TaxID=7654 RepID=UPI001BB13265|nr:SAP domain-containing ribonucleoprotein-like [Lytechinus variegatus]
MAEIEVKKLKIAELRKELTDRGLSSKGNKAELVERLTECLEVDGAEAVLDNELQVDPDVLTAEDDVDDLLNQDEDLDAGDIGEEEEAVVTRKVELEIEEEEEEVEREVKAPEIKKVVSPTAKPISDVEKKALRAQKFGVAASLSDADKKKARAERFGMQAPGSQAKPTATVTPTSKGISMSVNSDKLKQRAERFGKSVSPTAMKSEEAERIRKRKERFGAVTISAPGSKAKISAVGSDDVEAKKRKRAERFGMA